MHPQDYDGSIISLASVREFIHRRENRADNVSSALGIAFGRCPSESLNSLLLAGRIHRFAHPVSVGEEQITRIKLNGALLIG